MKILAAALQLPCEPTQVAVNRDRADAMLRTAHQAGAELAVLPEMFNTGYSLLPCYAAMAETADGPTMRHLRERSMTWKMVVVAGFVEREGNHLYDSLAACLPDGSVHVYRKRNLVFWERFRFCPGRSAVIVPTPFGRLGLAICADMIYRRVWEEYRERIDVAAISAAWPEFANRDTGRPHWLLGHIGPMSSAIPRAVAGDLGIPVIFSNQHGPTRTTIPLLGLAVAERLPDQFAGQSSISDGLHGPPTLAPEGEQLVLSPITIHARGVKPCRSTSPSVREVSSSGSAHS